MSSITLSYVSAFKRLICRAGSLTGGPALKAISHPCEDMKLEEKVHSSFGTVTISYEIVYILCCAGETTRSYQLETPICGQ